ncbi:MAG: penicillin-binding protein activator LpoB [Rhodanobacteraceae bacterium]|nr:penicillin-binding protein activator LpoB [Rhodanobacteraceae bacterium]
MNSIRPHWSRPLRHLAMLVGISLLPVAMAHAEAARPILGVLKFQDETGALPFQGGIGRVLTNILTNELAARPSFTVVERRRLQAILEEQELGASGRLRAGDGARIGALTGAQYLVMGTVTAFEQGVQRTRSRGLLGGLGGSKESSTSYLAIDLRVVDTSTGEISQARSIEGRATRTSSSISLDAGVAGFGYEALHDEALAKVVRAAVIEAIDYLECTMVVRDACVAAYADKDRRRLDGTRKAIKLDGNTR